MAAKVRIKAGPVEFEYESETELSLADIRELFSQIEALSKVPVLTEVADVHAPRHQPKGEQVVSSTPPHKLHVNSIAKKLAAKSGAQVAEAAAAALQIFEEKQTFSRSELHDMMKKATMHYKESMAGNLSRIIDSLVGSRFNQVSDGVYSSSSDAYHDLESKLA